ncbi:MAG: hypothetical protein M3N50_12505 [Pseudomonadota bacterium]|nr:hypothetical protein [Pseudomonadota bacterium]
MTPIVKGIANPVIRLMDGRVRQGVFRRVDAMERELAFLMERRDENVALIRRRGWTDDRLQLLFLLNSMYQQLIGPLQAAARGGPEGLGSTVAVCHGKTVFDRAGAARTQLLVRDFLAMIDTLKLQRIWLQSNTCGDVVFSIAEYERDQTRS